jgi:hypothetical protein
MDCVVTEIKIEYAAQEGGAHVVMACRKTRAANDLIQKWQKECGGSGRAYD